MNLKTIKSEVIPYPADTYAARPHGWGCGYVLIPQGTATYQRYMQEDTIVNLLQIKDLEDSLSKNPEGTLANLYREDLKRLKEGTKSMYYPQDFPCAHCTYFEHRIVDGIKYIVVGFDTMHMFNDSSDNEDYVTKLTEEIRLNYVAMLPKPIGAGMDTIWDDDDNDITNSIINQYIN